MKILNYKPTCTCPLEGEDIKSTVIRVLGDEYKSHEFRKDLIFDSLHFRKFKGEDILLPFLGLVSLPFITRRDPSRNVNSSGWSYRIIIDTTQGAKRKAVEIRDSEYHYGSWVKSLLTIISQVEKELQTFISTSTCSILPIASMVRHSGVTPDTTVYQICIPTYLQHKGVNRKKYTRVYSKSPDSLLDEVVNRKHMFAIQMAELAIEDLHRVRLKLQELEVALNTIPSLKM